MDVLNVKFLIQNIFKFKNFQKQHTSWNYICHIFSCLQLQQVKLKDLIALFRFVASPIRMSSIAQPISTRDKIIWKGSLEIRSKVCIDSEEKTVSFWDVKWRSSQLFCFFWSLCIVQCAMCISRFEALSLFRFLCVPSRLLFLTKSLSLEFAYKTRLIYTFIFFLLFVHLYLSNILPREIRTWRCHNSYKKYCYKIQYK